VRFNDPDNLVSCENFLQHAFPGAIKRDGRVLELTFRHARLASEHQRRVVERLLWAWRVSHRIDTDDGFVLLSEQPDIQTTN
jgi:hypothetical protein